MKPVRSAIRKKVLIVDREAVFRLGLRRLLSAEDDLSVAGDTENVIQAIHLARRIKPDVIFLQSDLVADKSSDLFGRLRSAAAGCKMVITAPALSNGEPLRYVRAGAAGVILKSVNPELFVKCARKVMENEIWLPKNEVAQMARLVGTKTAELQRPVDTLTQREKTIISYLVQGWRNREIAEQLSISEQTVKNHLRAVYDKVGVSDRLELVLYVLHQRVQLPAAPVAAVSQN
ncbi:MAG: LuxR C-terminal-related transcriptional regulator [Terriglobia bacterium]